MRFRPQAVRRLIATGASAAVAVALALAGAGVWALVAQQLTLEAVTVLVLWSLASWRPSRSFSRRCFRELFDFGARYSGIRVLWYLNGNADNLLIGVVLGPVALGYYAVGYRILVVVSELVVATINRVALTTFSRLQTDLDALNAAFCRATRTTAALCFPVYAGLALLAHPLVTLVFGAKWAPSASVLQALTLAGAIQAQTSFNNNYAIASGRVANELRWIAAVVGVQLVAFAAAVHFGIVAVALSLGAVTLLSWPIRLAQFRRWTALSLHAYLAPYPSLLAATAVMVGGVALVGQAAPGSGRASTLALQVTTGAVIYVVALLALAPRTTAELRHSVSQLRR